MVLLDRYLLGGNPRFAPGDEIEWHEIRFVLWKNRKIWQTTEEDVFIPTNSSNRMVLGGWDGLHFAFDVVFLQISVRMRFASKRYTNILVSLERTMEKNDQPYFYNRRSTKRCGISGSSSYFLLYFILDTGHIIIICEPSPSCWSIPNYLDWVTEIEITCNARLRR